jgi:hypothetical protein
MSQITTTISKTGQFMLQEDDTIVFQAVQAEKSFNLIPGAAIHVTNYDVSWIGFLMDNWYNYSGMSISKSGSDTIYQDFCDSYMAFRAQEWGPDQSNLIADTYFGDLPEGTDYLDVQVKMSNTVAPATVYGQPFSKYLDENNWVTLEGGASLVEGFSNYVQRMMAFIIDNTDPTAPKCLLRKRQSVRDITLSTVGSNKSAGFTVLNTNHGVFAYYLGHNSFFYNDFGTGSAPPGSAGSFRGGSTQCSQSTSAVSYATTWNGEIIVTPGRISAAS